MKSKFYLNISKKLRFIVKIEFVNEAVINDSELAAVAQPDFAPLPPHCGIARLLNVR